MLTDKQIQQAVTDELAWEPAVTSSNIGVTAHNGVVTLSGHVPTLWRKQMAEEAAQKVKGVRAVAEEIKVQLFDGGTFSDEKLPSAQFPHWRPTSLFRTTRSRSRTAG